MKSGIEKIFYGETHCDNIPATKKWKELHEKLQPMSEEFEKSLSEQQKQLFDEMFHYESGQCAEVELQCYKEGFKLGLLLALEVLSC